MGLWATIQTTTSQTTRLKSNTSYEVRFYVTLNTK